MIKSFKFLFKWLIALAEDDNLLKDFYLHLDLKNYKLSSSSSRLTDVPIKSSGASEE